MADVRGTIASRWARVDTRPVGMQPTSHTFIKEKMRHEA
jgi:hypothetical protein